MGEAPALKRRCRHEATGVPGKRPQESDDRLRCVPSASSGDGRLSVLMPVYNEAATVEEAVRQVLSVELPVDHELIVVDDGSTDGTSSALERLESSDGFRLLRHERNQGKGAAVRTALTAASGQFAAIFDADLEYDP